MLSTSSFLAMRGPCAQKWSLHNAHPCVGMCHKEHISGILMRMHIRMHIHACISPRRWKRFTPHGSACGAAKTFGSWSLCTRPSPLTLRTSRSAVSSCRAPFFCSGPGLRDSRGFLLSSPHELPRVLLRLLCDRPFLLNCCTSGELPPTLRSPRTLER